MSQENVEIVRGLYDAFNREDWDAALKDLAPGLRAGRLAGSRSWPGVFRPRSASAVLAGFWRWFGSPLAIEPQELIDAGDLVVCPRTSERHLKAAWRDRGRRLVSPMCGQFRDGRVVRIAMYSGAARMPSKPWGSRSRRCRRRTWGSCGESVERVELRDGLDAATTDRSTPGSSGRQADVRPVERGSAGFRGVSAGDCSTLRRGL